MVFEPTPSCQREGFPWRLLIDAPTFQGAQSPSCRKQSRRTCRERKYCTPRRRLGKIQFLQSWGCLTTRPVAAPESNAKRRPSRQHPGQSFLESASTSQHTGDFALLGRTSRRARKRRGYSFEG